MIDEHDDYIMIHCLIQVDINKMNAMYCSDTTTTTAATTTAATTTAATTTAGPATTSK